MARLQRYAGLTEAPNVYDYFDIVAGTGTGAVLACLLGLLRIPPQQAINYYQRLAEVFSDKKLIGMSAFKVTKLQEVFKGIVRDVTGDENTRMMDMDAGAEKCKTMVFAMSKHNMNAGIPCIFRSYQGTANQMPDCAIWEVLCATMAHPEHFKSVEIGRPPMRESFVDGGLGCTNPTPHVLAEAKALYPDRHLACVVSIGAGRASTIQVPEPSPMHGLLPAKVLAVTRDIAADGERVAQEMAVRFGQTTDVYFRFNVDQGIQNVKPSEWEKQPEVTAHARAYMRQGEISEKIDRAVRAIEERKDAISMAQIGTLSR
ncbi:hypothetical protein FRC06_000736 [Ceratobasidium sp. 370]|nr:hypothetical protein FRC06_000736 [Ceratobasidium sp. 370]